METSVPYHSGFLLGCNVDVRTMKPVSCKGQNLLSTTSRPEVYEEANLISRFSYISNLRDVCDVLSIPPEYALKVRLGVVKNEVVKTCLKDLGSKNVFSVVFRTSFVQKTDSLPHDSALKSSVATQAHKDVGEVEKTSETLTTEAAYNLESCHSGAKEDQHPTHWVRSVEIGDEQIVVMKISSKNEGVLKDLREKIDECLESSFGELDDKRLGALRERAAKIDKKLSKPVYSDIVNLNIHYGYFYEFGKYLADMSGMVDTLETFIDQCKGWKEMCVPNSSYEQKSCPMMCRVGEPLKVDPESKKVVTQDEEEHGEVGKEDEDHDSFVVLESSSPQNFYTLRVTLKSLHGGAF